MQSRTHVTLSFQMSQHADVGRWRHDHHANTRPAPLEMHCRACFRGPRPLCTQRRAVCAEPTRATAANQPAPMLVPGCAPGCAPQLLRQHPAHLPRYFFSYLESQGGFVASWFRSLHRAPHAGAMLSSRTRAATPARRAQYCPCKQLYGNAALYDPGYFCGRPLLRQDHGAACTQFDKRWTPFWRAWRAVVAACALHDGETGILRREFS
jgi:hypothetical protein